MTVIVKASGPADILAMVPPMIGFVPQNSVVFLAFRGKRTCGAMRFDLPAAATEAVWKRMITTMVGMLCKLPSVDVVIPVIYTDEGFAGSTEVPHADFAELLGRRIELSGFELRQSICSAADGWASYFESTVPAGGHPLDEVVDSNAAELIPNDLRELPARDAIPRRVPDAAPEAMTRMRKRLATYRRLIQSVTADSGNALPAALDPLGDLPLFAEDALGWDAAAIEANGALLAFMVQGPPARDLVMLQWATSIAVGDQMWDQGKATESLIPSAERPANIDIADLMMGIAPRPDPVRIEKGIALLMTLVAQLADEERPPLLCMLAWLTWALGGGTRAGRFLDEAVAINADYSMAELLTTMLGNGALPEWAFLRVARDR